MILQRFKRWYLFFSGFSFISELVFWDYTGRIVNHSGLVAGFAQPVCMKMSNNTDINDGSIPVPEVQTF